MKLRKELEGLRIDILMNNLENYNNEDLIYLRNRAFYGKNTGGKPAEAHIAYKNIQEKCEKILKERGIEIDIDKDVKD